MSLDSLCKWQVQVSVYCAGRIPAHLRCTQFSILLHLIDICFLFVYGRYQWVCMAGLPKYSKSVTNCWGREVSTQFTQQFVTAVTAPPRVGYVVWSHPNSSSTRVSCISTFKEPCCSLSTLSLLYFGMGPRQWSHTP